MRLPQKHLAQYGSATLHQVNEWMPPVRREGWQREAFDYNELIGEIGYLHSLTASLVSSADLRPVRKDPGTHLATEVDDPRVYRVMDGFVGPAGGRKELQRRAALHYQITGESYLVGTPLVDRDDISQGHVWEFLSTEEIKVEGSGKSMKVYRNSTGVSSERGVIVPSAYVARFWRPDPRFSQRADSPMKRVLPICRELVVLSEVVDAIAKSRLPAGILAIPDELSFGPMNENEDGSDRAEDIDPFIQMLIEHMSAPVNDRSSAAGLVPLVIKGAAEFLDKIRLISLAEDLDDTFQLLRAELLDRLGKSLDAPPEIIGGKGSLNHWTSYNVDGDFLSKHVIPIGQDIAEFVTVAYLRPMLVSSEGMSPEEALSYAVVFDARTLSARSDEGPAATGAWDRITLSTSSYLRANGFTEADEPSDEERRRRLLEKIVLSDPGRFAPSVLPHLYPELEGIDIGVGIGSRGPQGGEAVPVEPGANPQEPPEGQPAASPSGQPPGGASIEGLVDRLTIAADAALERALERAANRVLSRMNGKHPVLRDAFRRVPKPEVLGRMTELDYRSLDVTRDELLADAWDGFRLKARAWTRDALCDQGESVLVAEEVAMVAANDLILRLDALVSGQARLDVRSDGLRVPHELVRESLLATVGHAVALAASP